MAVERNLRPSRTHHLAALLPLVLIPGNHKTLLPGTSTIQFHKMSCLSSAFFLSSFIIFLIYYYDTQNKFHFQFDLGLKGVQSSTRKKDTARIINKSSFFSRRKKKPFSSWHIIIDTSTHSSFISSIIILFF